MNLEQYIGCVISWNGHPAIVDGATDCYEGVWYTLRYLNSADGGSVKVDAFDARLMHALPDPQCGILKRREKDVVFTYGDAEYLLGDQPYEPCLYIKKDGTVFRTLHNAFTVDDLPEFFAEGKTLTGIDGREYGLSGFCRVLAAAIDSSRSEMDFPYAAKLVPQK